MDTRSAIRLALSMAATYQTEGRDLGREAQGEIEREVERLSDSDIAMRCRDAALREAHRVCRNSVTTLASALKAFETNTWPCWRWEADPPKNAGPLQRAMFDATRCQIAIDGTPSLPNERRLRQVVQSSYSDFTPGLEY